MKLNDKPQTHTINTNPKHQSKGCILHMFGCEGVHASLGPEPIKDKKSLDTYRTGPTLIFFNPAFRHYFCLNPAILP